MSEKVQAINHQNLFTEVKYKQIFYQVKIINNVFIKNKQFSCFLIVFALEVFSDNFKKVSIKKIK